jgi:hypothetical protein
MARFSLPAPTAADRDLNIEIIIMNESTSGDA